MLIRKWRGIWLLETLVLVVLLVTAYSYASAVVIPTWLGIAEIDFPSVGEPYALLVLAAGIVTVFICSGYFLTTAIFMLILKQLAIWLLETLGEVVLLAGFLLVLFVFQDVWSGDDLARVLTEYADGLFQGFLIAIAGIVTVLITSGYVLTTSIFGVVWRSQRLWLYPAVAAVLFLAHLQLMFIDLGTSSAYARWGLRLGGVCVVLTCTTVGNLVLRRWGKGSVGQEPGLFSAP